jgi:hypothetical protein
MLKRTITYEDTDGARRTEDFYFNLSKAELLEMKMTTGLEEYLQSVVTSTDGGVVMAAFKDLIGRAVGERTDGGRFIKSDEITAAFLSSDAYSELLMSLISDENASTTFFNGIVPKDLVETLKSTNEREYSPEELLAMDQAQFDRIVGTDANKMSRDHLVIAMQRRNHQPA